MMKQLFSLHTQQIIGLKYLLSALAVFVSSSAFACNDACKRAKAEADNNIKFASHLTATYCADTTKGFILREIKGLQSYREQKLPIPHKGHRGGAKNIRVFLTQRKEWLAECDKYLELTGQGRAFYDKETTDKIMGTIGNVADELQKVMMTPQKPDENLDAIVAPAVAQFDLLFEQLETHKLLMQRKGVF